MIDWPHVALNALWILGGAVILAALSYTSWLAQVRGLPTRQLLGGSVFQLPLSIGLSLVSFSLFFLSRGWLERVLWAAFTVVFAWQCWDRWRHHG